MKIYLLLFLSTGILYAEKPTFRGMGSLSRAYEIHTVVLGDQIWLAGAALEVFKPNGERIAVTSVPQGDNILGMSKYDDRTVALTGRYADEGNGQSYYALATIEGSKIKIETHPIPFPAFAMGYLGKLDGTLFFRDDGGKPTEPSLQLQPLPQTIFTLNADEEDWLPARLHRPEHPVQIGRKLFVVESPWGLGGIGITEVDLETGASHRRLIADQIGFANLIPLSDGKTLAATNYVTNEVVLWNSENSSTSKISFVGQNPLGLSQLQNCLVVSNDATEGPNRISVYSLKTMKAVSELDLSGFPKRIPKGTFKDLAADPQSYRLYAQYEFPVKEGPITVMYNGLILIEGLENLRSQCSSQ